MRDDNEELEVRLRETVEQEATRRPPRRARGAAAAGTDRARAVEVLAVQGSCGASVARADRVGGGDR